MEEGSKEELNRFVAKTPNRFDRIMQRVSYLHQVARLPYDVI